MNGVVSLLNVSALKRSHAALTDTIAAGHRKAEAGLLAGLDDGLVVMAGEAFPAVDGDGEDIGHVLLN